MRKQCQVLILRGSEYMRQSAKAMSSTKFTQPRTCAQVRNQCQVLNLRASQTPLGFPNFDGPRSGVHNLPQLSTILYDYAEIYQNFVQIEK